VTDAESVRMLWGEAMKFRSTPLGGIGLLLASLAVHCEPHDQFSPPATPNGSPNLPPPPEPVAAGESQDTPAAPEGDATMYSSGEVTVGAEKDTYDDDDPAALTDFHAALDTHGSWVDDSTYGTVWVPSTDAVGADFQPYVTAGHWVYDDDWVWVSDYDWGWAPFHYGRWVWIAGRGWVWIPGRAYRGAWVEWGVDDGYGYIGWAPLAPSFVWFGGAAVVFPGYVGPRWVYCRRGEVFSPSVRTRVLAGPEVNPVAARVHPYVPAAGAPGGVAAAGPPPQKIGFQSAQIPHSTGATSVAHAQQFARPASAQALGAHAPARVSPQPAAISSPLRSPSAGTIHPSNQFRAPFTTGGHGVGVRPAAPAQVARPAVRAPSFHVGGGGHHR
jgi:hypothetical protein